MRRPLRVSVSAVLLVGVCSLIACGGNGSGWGIEAAPVSSGPSTVARSLGEEATIHGPNSLALRVSLDFIRQPPVPVSLSPETATFLEMHLSVTNTGTAPFSGVLADAADLAVVPSGTLAPVRAETVPSEIPLSGGLDFGEPVSIAPGAPPVQGKMVFQIDPDDEAASFSLTFPGGMETARWIL
jgi:hypothetical protein